MKTINQLVCDQTKYLPTREDGSVDPGEALRVKLETYARFWAPWLVILNPDGKINPYLTLDNIFSGEGRAGLDDRVAGAKLLKEKLGVNRIGWGTFFELRRIIADAVQASKRHEGVDIALCALMTFMQLELGAEPDPEYGQFPEREYYVYRGELYDADLSDDPVTAEIELDGRGPTYDDGGTSEYLLDKWFYAWKDIVDDPERFEERFPGTADRRANVARALAPVFSRLDSVLDGYVLDQFLRWIKPLLERPLDENRTVGPPRTDSMVVA